MVAASWVHKPRIRAFHFAVLGQEANKRIFVSLISDECSLGMRVLLVAGVKMRVLRPALRLNVANRLQWLQYERRHAFGLFAFGWVVSKAADSAYPWADFVRIMIRCSSWMIRDLNSNLSFVSSSSIASKALISALYSSERPSIEP